MKITMFARQVSVHLSIIGDRREADFFEKKTGEAVVEAVEKLMQEYEGCSPVRLVWEVRGTPSNYENVAGAPVAAAEGARAEHSELSGAQECNSVLNEPEADK